MGTEQRPFLVPREELIPGDVLRLGFEDESGHVVTKVRKYVPKKGRLYFKPSSENVSRKGTPVFLLDRREKELEAALSGLQKELNAMPGDLVPPSTFTVKLPGRSKKRSLGLELFVFRNFGKGFSRGEFGLWISEETSRQVPKSRTSGLWWWLPPVIWPDSEKKIQSAIDMVLKQGGRNFILNAPWQTAFFNVPKRMNLWAGPFCNITNVLSIDTLASLGFSGVIVSPELGKDDFLSLPKQSPLPLGIVISANWPLCISRTLSEHLKPETPFISVRGEQAWVKKNESDFWIFPNWKLDIREMKHALQMAGYSLFVHLIEPVPESVTLKKRPGIWNWEINLF
jgi:putative protease